MKAAAKHGPRPPGLCTEWTQGIAGVLRPGEIVLSVGVAPRKAGRQVVVSTLRDVWRRVPF